jgi:hypothetical protein
MGISNRRTVKPKKLLTIFSLMVLLFPTFIMHYENRVLTYMYLPLESLSIIYLSKGNFLKIKHIKYMLFIVTLEAAILIPTIIDKRLSYSYVCMLIAETFLVLHILRNTKSGLQRIVVNLSTALSVLWIIDIISVLFQLCMNSHTINDFGFVGHKNYHAFLFVLVIGFKIMSNILTGKKVIDKKVTIIASTCIVIEFIVGSASGAFTVITIVTLCFLVTKNKLNVFSLTNLFIGELILNYILIFAISESRIIQNILNLMGRDIGMSGRGAMWRYALNLIGEHPMRGYGHAQPILVWNMNAGNYVQNHCHNFFLNLMLSGGLIYFIIFIGFVLVVAKKLNDNGNNIVHKVLAYTIACYLLIGTSEIIVTVMPVLFPLLTLGFYSKNIKMVGLLNYEDDERNSVKVRSNMVAYQEN